MSNRMLVTMPWLALSAFEFRRSWALFFTLPAALKLVVSATVFAGVVYISQALFSGSGLRQPYLFIHVWMMSPAMHAVSSSKNTFLSDYWAAIDHRMAWQNFAIHWGWVPLAMFQLLIVLIILACLPGFDFHFPAGATLLAALSGALLGAVAIHFVRDRPWASNLFGGVILIGLLFI